MAPLLTELSKDTRVQLIGVNYKDTPDNARRFLDRYGNPFSSVGLDGNRLAAIDGASMAPSPRSRNVGRNRADQLVGDLAVAADNNRL